jgi:hypothetical protein
MAHSNDTTTTAPEQLALLSPGELPLQFRLDQRTRQSGLAHIAAIKAQLAARAAARQADAAAHTAPTTTRTLPARRAA